MSKLIGIVLIVATAIAGLYVDVVKLFVGGIVETVNGVKAHPVSGGQIGWGLAHIAFSGAGLTAAFFVCVLWAAVFFRR